MKNYTILAGQSLFDIALMCYGDVIGVVYLIEDNNLSGPTDRLYVGQILRVRSEPIDMRKKLFLEEYDTIATITQDDMPEGIGYWRLDEYVIS